MRRVAGTVLVGLLGFGSGCSLEATDPDVEIVVIEEPAADSRVSHDRVSRDSYDQIDWPRPDEVSDPCDCDSSACLDQWVSKNLGCDVCVVLRCGDRAAQHVCSYCDPAHGPEHPQ